MKNILILFLLFISSFAFAQSTFPVEGIQDERTTVYAYTNAAIFTDYQTKIEKGVLLVQDGRVLQVGPAATIKLEKNYVITDLKGQNLYPAFVELSSDYGISLKEKKESYQGKRPIPFSQKKGAYHWNQAIRPEMDASEYFTVDKSDADALRKAGFGAALSHIRNGIARGTGTVVLLTEGRENDLILKTQATSHFSFDKGTSNQDYPSSLMGCIALIRQTYLDAQWYENQRNPEERNLSLEAWNENSSLPAIFEARDKLEILRADKIGDEFGKQYIIRTKGDEYQNVEAVAATKAPLIVPLNFPKPVKFDDPNTTAHVPLKNMKHWELAPSNPSVLAKAAIPFALSADGLKDKGDFLKNLKKAVKFGLSEQEALKALTYQPASMMGLEGQIGSLKKGMRANFIVSDGNLFEDDSELSATHVGEMHYEYKKTVPYPLSSRWELSLDGKTFELLAGEKACTPKMQLIQLLDGEKDTLDVTIKNVFENVYMLEFSPDSNITWYLNGWMNSNDQPLSGSATGLSGIRTSWKAKKIGVWNPEADKKEEQKEAYDPTKELGAITYPFLPFGYTKSEIPATEEVLFKNATVWTNEKDGILKNTDVHIKNGKILAVGKDLNVPTAKVIDATDMHLTSGIIDEHSHIAASRGLNEGTQASSAEVRVEDIINSEDINIYRQLAGGVTASQILHGSANPVGGQSGLIKLRWGQVPENMLISGADGFIKFALGENVKQSNWGDKYRSRFPQTRMGVEQLYYDLFTRARQYDTEWKTYNKLKRKEKAKTQAPRRDLELEALAEVVNSERFITCHSYQQGEINMLMHVADSMGFRVNTFTHILEGYKVADKMKAHGVGGSTFSDWWAYKFEVNDAIPYNAAMMNRMGITTAINSDDAEMGRRLNQEAAKSVKYGGATEEEAWKMVTLNPAKLLHLDDRMGSLKVGKDADIVLWTANPLSIYAQVKQTYIDGKLMYDQGRSAKKSEAIQLERRRLIQKMEKAIESGEKPEKPDVKKQRLYHCDTMGE